jgi:hypothetical protein
MKMFNLLKNAIPKPLFGYPWGISGQVRKLPTLDGKSMRNGKNESPAPNSDNYHVWNGKNHLSSILLKSTAPCFLLIRSLKSRTFMPSQARKLG